MDGRKTMTADPRPDPGAQSGPPAPSDAPMAGADAPTSGRSAAPADPTSAAPTFQAEPPRDLIPARHASSGGPAGLERDAMAWPPAAWERAPTAWRDDLWQVGTPPLPVPRDAGGAADVLLPPSGLPGSGEATAPDTDKPGSRTRGMLRDVAETVVLTALIFFAIRTLVQNFKIEGSSMLPTLESEQYVLVNKLAYFGFGEPQRGDIVVFASWNDPEKDYIKRIIGLPGETIEIKDRRVFIDKSPLAEPYLDPPSTSPAYGPLVLGEDEYFVMGDNRGNSSDSRQHDAMSVEQLIGKAWITYWPPAAMRFVPDGGNSYADDDGLPGDDAGDEQG
jgi:signal peptidase I